MNIQDFFIKHHYISLSEVAERAGINHSLLPIQKAVRAIGNDLSKATITTNANKIQ